MIRPNPDVYRKAAQYIADKREGYSCEAIRRACEHFRLPDTSFLLYKMQYYAAFACRPGRVLSIPSFSHLVLDQDIAAVPWFEHPFWNHAPDEPGCRECRILALLFMAELVSNP